MARTGAPTGLQTRARRGAAALRDRAGAALERLRPGGEVPIPPRRLVDPIGGGDYVAIGDEFFGLFRRAGLRAGDDVLDVGCGAGRMARPLAGWLRGDYEGFDVTPRAVAWCERNIASRHANFGFTCLDLANDLYNPEGAANAGSVRFPYPDARFDFAFLTSVFTHLMPGAVLRYAEELARVVRPGGTVFATWFLLDPRSRAAVSAGDAGQAFHDAGAEDPTLGPHLIAEPERPGAAVAYDGDRVCAALASRGLPVAERWPGLWADAPDGVTFQDVTVSRVER